MSFNICARARPVRTAFLLNEAAGFNAVCDGLVKWSNEFWGGRQSAVVLVEPDGKIAPDTWEELIRFDPDRIYSFVQISDELLTKLDDELSPWHIRQPKEGQLANQTTEYTEESVQSPSIPVPPTKQNLESLQSRPLLLFNFGKGCPTHLRRFIHRNLGAYDQWFKPRTGEPCPLGRLENLLANVAVERIRVDDLPSLCGAMERISGTPLEIGGKRSLSFTAPCELSSSAD